MGKTYAAWFGPVMQALRQGEGDDSGRGQGRAEPIRVLWITPLRALAGDTAAALRQTIDDLALPWSVELRTSDVSASVRQRQRVRPPTALVTTPESLSLLLSYPGARERFATLRCVVADEWHELMSTKRGVQTELGLARLRRWRPTLRTWGLSATLGNLEQARDVLLGPGGAAAGRLIHGQLPKQVDVVTLMPDTIERFPWAGHMGVKLLPQVLEAIERAGTSLLFTNTRSQAELWFHAILRAKPDWIGRVAIHHGSLDRAIRQQVERLIRDGRLRAVVCTSSLDLGVDFAPVEQVLQLGSPKGVARLMQRAGRSGHQPGVASRVLGVPTHAFELIEFSAAREAIAERAIEPREPLDKPLDVLVQHLVTVASDEPFDPAELYDEVRATHAFRDLTAGEWAWALDFVARGGPALRAYPQHGRLRRDAKGRYAITDARFARRHRLGIGTITADASIAVRFRNGRKLGTVEESFIARLRPGDRFLFGGRHLELIRVHAMSAWVRPARGRKGTVPRWGGTRFPLSTQLAARVRRRLGEVRDGTLADEPMRRIAPLLELQRAWSRLPQDDELLIERTRTREGHHAFLYPFAGRLAHEGLGAVLAHRLAHDTPRSIVVNANDYGLELLTSPRLDVTADAWRDWLTPDRLIDDLLACLNTTELARRAFRDVARIAGLVSTGFPGEARSNRQLQASSDLFFDVFRQFDPHNLLLDQARREVLAQQLEVRRLSETLNGVARLRIIEVETRRLSPLAFPLWADRLREHEVSTERWQQRVERMAARLEAEARRQDPQESADAQANDRRRRRRTAAAAR